MIEWTQRSDGIVLSVRAQPRARRNGILGVHGGALKVAVTDPPEMGKANEAIAALLAEHFGMRKSQVRLISGEASRTKRFFLAGAPADFDARLQSLTERSTRTRRPSSPRQG